MLRTKPIPALLLSLATFASAQTHHVAPPEKVTRAIAVFEWTGDLSKPTASRLVPVSLFINGHFEDAGLYLARPVPFALEPGDLYSVEEAGEEKGTLDLEHARDFTTGRLLADKDPVGAWYGFGRFAPLSPPKPGPALHASAHPPVIVTSSDPNRPHLSSKAPETTDSKGSDAKPASDASTNGAKTPMGDDPDRPTLGRRADTSGDSQTSPTARDAPATGSPTDTDPERPTLRKRSPESTGKKSPPKAGVTGPDRSLNDDPDRPRIGRGKTAAQEDAAELKNLPADMHQVAAVSDPARREPHLFAREWDSPAERTAVLSRLQGLARTEVTAYLGVNHLTPGVPPPAAPSATATASPGASAPATTTSPSSSDKDAPVLRRAPGGVNTSTTPAQTPSQPQSTTKTATGRMPARTRPGVKSSKSAKPPALTFTAEQLDGYTLSYGGLATFVYTAQVPVTAGGPVYVTLVAQRLPSGEFQVALRSVTDATHLDRTPWMRPIDVVDPDASHRADLLFELRAQSSRQFALYRLLSAQAEQEFISQPIE